MTYPHDAINRARDCALDWLTGNTDGYPRSWDEEARQNMRRGYDIYGSLEAPPIAGYEALERDGLVDHMETIVREGGEERVHFRLKHPDGEVDDGGKR